MFIVNVSPIQKRRTNTLSYFSTSLFPVGSVVQIPIRKKVVPALVLSCDDAKNLKATLRSNVYETKKLPVQKSTYLYDEHFIQASRKTSDYFATALNVVVQSYTPSAILSDISNKELQKTMTQNDGENIITTYEKCALQLPHTERIEKYKTLIRSTLAQKKSLHICVPTTREVHSLHDEITQKGVEKYIYMLESSQTPKTQRTLWRDALAEKHPIVLITTPTFLSIPRNDIGTYLIEHEGSAAFKQQQRPSIDARILIEYLAKSHKCSLIVADTVLSTSTHKDIQEGFVRQVEGHSRTLRTKNEVHLIDTLDARTSAKEAKQDFPVLTPDALEVIATAKERGENTFVFAPRRGIASYTVCNDCSAPVRCSSCKASLTLHEYGGERKLLCHRCGYTNDANIQCTTCGSWNLMPLGIGIERIITYIQKNSTGVTVFNISSDATPTSKKALSVAEEFYTTKGSVLVGTQMALSYLFKPVAYSIMASLDAFMSIPDFRIEEKVFSIIATLRETTTHILLIETTDINNQMLTYARKGALDAYVSYELNLRKQLGYPPYTRLIQISCLGKKEKVINDMQMCITQVKEYNPRVFQGFIPHGHDVELTALIRIKSASWPNFELVNILRSLPFSFTVTIDPDKML